MVLLIQTLSISQITRNFNIPVLKIITFQNLSFAIRATKLVADYKDSRDESQKAKCSCCARRRSITKTHLEAGPSTG